MGFPVGPPLLLPEWNGFFDSIDRLATRGKRVVSMGGARRDADRNIADPKLTDAMDGSDPDARVLRGNALEYTLHLFDGETLMGFVVEACDLVAVRVVTHDPVEDAYTTRSRVFDRFSDFVE